MIKIVRPVLVLLLSVVVVGTGCDLGTYERRTAEPMSSKLKVNQPASAPENSTEAVE